MSARPARSRCSPRGSDRFDPAGRRAPPACSPRGDPRRARQRQRDDADPGRRAGRVLRATRATGWSSRTRSPQVEIDVAPLASRQRFDERSLPAASTPEARLARAVAAGAKTRFEAVSRILGWISANVRYELDRTLAQDPRSVLARRSAYCTGPCATRGGAARRARHPRARDRRLRRRAIFPAGRGAGFHRWIEVFYDDRGWVFSDPLASHNFVAGDLPAARFERRGERSARAGAPAVARQPARGDRPPGAGAGPARAGARQRQRAGARRRCA